MPNTLLEAIVMGAFPIQSNPGGATAEIITDGENGFLIQQPEDIEEIKQNIVKAITDIALIKSTSTLNDVIVQEKLDYSVNKKKLLAIYKSIAQYKCNEKR
ncbi:MAG: glycosyltransferase [Flavobacterium sp.]